MHFRHQRARRVEHMQTATPGLLLDSARDTVGAEYHGGIVWNIVQLLDEHGAFSAQPSTTKRYAPPRGAHKWETESFKPCSTISIARSTPAQKPRGLANGLSSRNGAQRLTWGTEANCAVVTAAQQLATVYEAGAPLASQNMAANNSNKKLRGFIV